MLNDTVSDTVLNIYRKKGIKSVLSYCNKCLLQCEKGSNLRNEKSIIKGELGEMALYCLLHYLQANILKMPCLIVKGLYVKDTYTESVTEIDVIFATPYNIFIFECKSYSGEGKYLTEECTVNFKNRDSRNVFEQNKLHLVKFNKRYGQFVKLGSKPYKLALFDYATPKYKDTRTLENKNKMPCLRIDNICDYVIRTTVDSIKKGEVVELNKLKESIKKDVKLHSSELKMAHKKQLMY